MNRMPLVIAVNLGLRADANPIYLGLGMRYETGICTIVISMN